METLPPKRSLFVPDYWRLAVLVAVAAAIHGWLLCHTAVTARDSLGFARYALNIQSPHATTHGDDQTRTAVSVIQSQQHPPGYPVAVWAAAKVVRTLAPGRPHAETTLLATQVVSCVAAVLLVVPTYLIGRMLFDRSAGFAAALLFQTLPVAAQVTSDGLTEGLYLLFAAVALMFAVRAVRRPGVGGFLLAGLAVGASYLVRPEGAIVAAALGLVAVGLGVRGKWPRRSAVGRVTALCVGFALAATPYMVLIKGITQKPSGGAVINPGETPRDAIWKGHGAAPAAGGPLFAKWQSHDEDGTLTRAGWAVAALATETVKTMNYGPAALAVLGLFAFRRRLWSDPGLLVLLVLVGLNTALLVMLGTRVGYVSERHTLLIALVGCVFAAAALEPVVAALAAIPGLGRAWGGRFAACGLLVALAAAGVPGATKPMHQNREGHKHAGRWLAGRLAEHEANREPVIVLDPFCWAGWYSGHTLYYEPLHDPKTRVHYVILEPNAATPHSRLPALAAAQDVAKSGTVVYHWPEDGPPERAAVHVVKTVR